MNKYILIGMRGVGKSTVAKEMASLAPSYVHYDTDDIFETQHNTSIYSYIMAHGVTIFRQHESNILRTIIQHNNAIISTGGGAVTVEHNRTLLTQERDNKVHIIFLHVPLDILYKRRTFQESHRPRPILYDAVDISDEISVSWKKRKKWYYMLATHTIYTEGKSPQEVAQEILSL